VCAKKKGKKKRKNWWGGDSMFNRQVAVNTSGQARKSSNVSVRWTPFIAE